MKKRILKIIATLAVVFTFVIMGSVVAFADEVTLPASIEDAGYSVNLKTETYFYNGSMKMPEVTITYEKDGVTSTLDSGNYTVSYSANTKVGTAKVIIRGTGSHTGVVTKTFTIKPNMSDTDKTIYIGSTYTRTAKSNTTVNYTTSNKAIATVSSKGAVKGIKAGTVTIKATSNNVSTSYKVKVIKPTVSLNASSKKLLLGQSYTFKATPKPNVKVTWSSSNTKVATVSSKGKVYAKKYGSSTVTAKIKYKGKTYSKSAKVTVSKVSKVTGVKTLIKKDNAISISWNKVSGASGYALYKSNSKSSGFKRIAILGSKTTSCQNIKLTLGKTYYYKIRAFKKYNKKNYYGSYSSVAGKKSTYASPKYSIKITPTASKEGKITFTITNNSKASTMKFTNKYYTYDDGDENEETVSCKLVSYVNSDGDTIKDAKSISVAAGKTVVITIQQNLNSAGEIAGFSPKFTHVMYYYTYNSKTYLGKAYCK